MGQETATGKPKKGKPSLNRAVNERFRMRYQDGVVELSIGVMLLLLTLINQSEYFFTNQEWVRLSVLVQPILSLVLFAGGVFLMRYVRGKVVGKRDDVEVVPLPSPMKWINLVMMILLISAPLVWPLQRYTANVLVLALGGLGCAAGFILLILGIYFRFQRFLLLGVMICILSILFSFVGEPGSLANQLAILLGVSGVFLISGGYTLFHFFTGRG
jgi:hypothetical protein